MLYKIVFGTQIRILDCKDTLTLETLREFVHKSYPKLEKYYFYYIDEEGDEIVLESGEDIAVLLEIEVKKPKIYIKE